MVKFYGFEFIISNDVLCPYKSTEVLVETVIDKIKQLNKPSICDIGTGSGNILVSVLNIKQDAIGVGIDISTEALKIAQQNVNLYGLENRVKLVTSDCFSSLVDEKFDIISCNPPYCSEEEYQTTLTEKDKLFIPKIAITDGEDGMRLTTKLVKDSPKYLKNKGALVIEINKRQEEATLKLFNPKIWKTPVITGQEMVTSRILCAELIDF